MEYQQKVLKGIENKLLTNDQFPLTLPQHIHTHPNSSSNPHTIGPVPDKQRIHSDDKSISVGQEQAEYKENKQKC